MQHISKRIYKAFRNHERMAENQIFIVEPRFIQLQPEQFDLHQRPQTETPIIQLS
jgi:hypothetical protein